jgi:hypothetical protein
MSSMICSDNETLCFSLPLKAPVIPHASQFVYFHLSPLVIEENINQTR